MEGPMGALTVIPSVVLMGAVGGLPITTLEDALMGNLKVDLRGSPIADLSVGLKVGLKASLTVALKVSLSVDLGVDLT
jgi:hypothetical protein